MASVLYDLLRQESAVILYLLGDVSVMKQYNVVESSITKSIFIHVAKVFLIEVNRVGTQELAGAVSKSRFDVGETQVVC
jgi:hypothetical protein